METKVDVNNVEFKIFNLTALQILYEEVNVFNTLARLQEYTQYILMSNTTCKHVYLICYYKKTTQDTCEASLCNFN